MLSSLVGLLTAVAGAAVAALGGLLVRHRYQILKEERDRMQATRDATEQAAQRLEAARKATVHPIDPQRRTDFEGQP